MSYIPDGYRLAAAGMGTQLPHWGDDSVGTDEPFTLLRRADGASADMIVVSTTGFEGYQGKLAQASRGYTGPNHEFSVDGRQAIFTPAAGGVWADLVAIAGDDVAVRVTAPSASQEQLVEILRRVEVSGDRTLAPSVVEPPDGFEVVGSLDADAVAALAPWVTTYSEQAPGPPTAHAAGWLADDEREMLSVLSLPGGAASLSALAGAAAVSRWSGDIEVEMMTVAGGPAALVERVDGDGWVTRAVWLQSAWGDTVVVTASGQAVPEVAALQAVAESVRPSDPSTWEALVVEADGGPGLNPDQRRRELMRGTIGDLEWLLQTGTADTAPVLTGEETDSGADDSVDPCLKLSERRRACPTNGHSGLNDWLAYTEAAPYGMPPFMVVSTTADAVELRVTTATETVTVPLAPIPETPVRGAVVMAEELGRPTCPAAGEAPTPPPGTMRVEMLDAAGNVVQCRG